MNELKLRALNHLEAKLFFCKKDIEQSKLELDGVIHTFLDIELVETRLKAEERKLEVLNYLINLVETDSEKKCKNNCKKTCE